MYSKKYSNLDSYFQVLSKAQHGVGVCPEFHGLVDAVPHGERESGQEGADGCRGELVELCVPQGR